MQAYFCVCVCVQQPHHYTPTNSELVTQQGVFWRFTVGHTLNHAIIVSKTDEVITVAAKRGPAGV